MSDRHQPTPLIVCRAHPKDFGVRCEDEPIRTPSAIQPVGVLLAATAKTGLIHHVSANCADLLARPPEQLLNQDIRAVLAERRALPKATKGGISEGRHGVDAQGGRLYIHHHRQGDHLIVELEPARAHAAEAPCRSAHFARLVRSLHEAGDVKALYAAAVVALREITGFDRVLMYVFDPLWHGQVVAEQVAKGVPSYLGLRFPSSDIPAQARELYVQMPLRFVVDAGYRASPLVTLDAGAEPLDLTCAVLRSLSPLHQEYMRALNLSASLSISVLVGGKLSGLLSCAHEAGPKAVCPANRNLCNIIALTLSSLIPLKRAGQRRRRGAQRKAIYAQLFRQIEQTHDFARILCGPRPNMLSLVAASGAAVWYGQTLSTVGQVPAEAVLMAIIAWSRGKKQASRVFSCHDLPSQEPKLAAHHALVAGLLLVYFPRQSEACVMWFRPSRDTTVAWGGNPQAKESVQRVNAPPGPRQSFARWRQEVRLQSKPFSAGDRQAAAYLVDVVAEGVLRHTERLTSLVRELGRSNAELDAFAHAASHDLKEPLRSISALAKLAAHDERMQQAGEGEAAGGQPMETIVSLSRRMDGLLDALLRYAALGRSELSCLTFSPKDLVTQARHVLMERIQGRQARVTLDDSLPSMWGDPVLIGELLVNLIGNGIKYNVQAQPSVHVGSLAHPDEKVVFYVRDNGIGINPSGQQRVFDIFRRLHDKQAFGGGTGAGLTISKRIVERHGGRLWLESQVDVGTTFFFTLSGEQGASA